MDGRDRMRGRSDVPAGLVAWAPPLAPGAEPPRDRRGRARYRRVFLAPDEPGPPVRPDGFTDADFLWATRARRRWSSIEQRFGDRAVEVAHTLARSNCVELVHDFESGSVVQPPRGWVPNESLLLAHAEEQESSRAGRAELADVAARLRRDLGPDWPGVAGSLTGVGDGRLRWAVRAAQDLLDGRSHDGARAFVQAHAGDTKAREDLPQLLRDLGWEPRALSLIGVSRSPYLGIAGPLRARSGRHVIDVTGWPGPHDLRLPPAAEIALELTAPATHLLVVENRQAAEALADEFPGLPVIWCHGQPPARALSLIAAVAAAVTTTVVAPDADLGGVRIAARIHDGLPDGARARVLDAGAAGATGRPFGPAALAALERLGGRPDPVGDFARACHERGHRVEQEAAVRTAVRRFLREDT